MNKLRILVANNTLSLLAGSETWTKTLALQLKKMGHHVDAFSPQLGTISNDLEEAGIKCYPEMATSNVKPFSFVIEEKRDYSYDVIIANHNHIVDYLREQFPDTPIISTIHGIIHLVPDALGKQVRAPEHPALEANVNQFVAVSEEVKELLQKQYGIDAMIVRNFFDLEKFKADRPTSPGGPKAILLNTNYASSDDDEVKVIKAVAKHYGAKMMAVGENFSLSKDTMKAIEDADIVVGMGRSVLEGVAAGRLGIVHGRWGTGGIVCADTIEQLRSFNFSGRNSGGTYWTVEDFIREIDRHYSLDTIDWGMNYMRREHNVEFAAEVFIQTARMLKQSKNTEAEVPLRPYRRAYETA